MPQPVPAAASPAALPAVAHPAPVPAADQLRPAFAAALSPAAPGRVVVRLEPAELGRIQVGILRHPDGPARIELLAERPDTLQLLMRDQPALHRALDQAGVPADGRVLHFQLGTPDATRDAPPPAPSSAQAGPSLGTGLGAGLNGQPGGSNAGGGQSGSQGGGRGQPPGWAGSTLPGGRDAGPTMPRPFRTAAGVRPGVDITA